MIAVLVDDAVERVIGRRQVFWLQGILENGFSGFAGWTDEQLRKEMAARGCDLTAIFLDEDTQALERDSMDNDDLSMYASHIGSVGDGYDSLVN